MRGTTARHLRQIARKVNAEPKTSYGFAKLRGYWERMHSGRRDHSTTRMMKSCFREVYKTAKKISLGKPLSAMELHQ